MNNKVSRRTFLGKTATAAAFTIISNHAVGNILAHRASTGSINKNIPNMKRKQETNR